MEEAPKCQGGCIAGQAAKIKSCEITTLDVQPGSDFSCRFVTKGLACEELEKMVNAANKKHGEKSWVYDYCSKGCKCSSYTLDKTKTDISIEDYILEHTAADTPFGRVHCIFKVSGKIVLAAGALALVGCEPEKKPPPAAPPEASEDEGPTVEQGEYYCIEGRNLVTGRRWIEYWQRPFCEG